MKVLYSLPLIAAGLAMVSCTPMQQQWGLGGAAAGAAAGAVLGNSSEDILRGGVIGAAGGAGAAAYKEHQNGQQGAYNTGGDSPTYNNPAPTTQAPAPVPQNHPTATSTSQPGIVVSPHAPYNKVDVSSFQSGQLARDPFTKQIFRIP